MIRPFFSPRRAGNSAEYEAWNFLTEVRHFLHWNFFSLKSVLQMHKKPDFRYPTSPGIRPVYPLSGFKNIRRPAGRISCKIEIRRIPSTSSKSQVQYKWYKLRIFQRSIQKVYFFTFVLYFRIIMSLCIFITYHMFFI